MDKDWTELLSLFDHYGVRYLIVGGYAVMFHAQPRGTKDLDLYLDSSKANAQAVFSALVAFGAPMANMTVEDFENASSVYQIGQPPLRIDLIGGLENVEFAAAWKNRVDTMEGAVPVHYIGAEELIANKLAAARPQDIADVEAIRTAQRVVSSYRKNTRQ